LPVGRSGSGGIVTRSLLPDEVVPDDPPLEPLEPELPDPDDPEPELEPDVPRPTA
jgi:hypothetical protein